MTHLYALRQQHFPADRSRTVREAPDGRRMSYAELDAGCARIARLLGDCGVRPRDRVAAQIEKSSEALLLYLAVLRSGSVYLPLNTAYKGGEVAYFLQDAEPRVLFSTPENAASLCALSPQQGVCAVLTLPTAGSGSPL